MSKPTLALIAAASAAAGAAGTAAYFTMGARKNASDSTAMTTTTTATAIDTTSPSALPDMGALPPAAAAVARTPRSAREPTTAPVDPAGVFQYGFPGPVHDVATRQALVSSFDRRTRNPAWVAEHITPASLAAADGDRRHAQFVEDDAVPGKFRARLADYFRSGYDRGHLVPAADAKWAQSALDETFYLTNMCPQVGEGFNRDYWAHLEDFCRRLTRTFPSVRIVSGPLYLPRRETAGDDAEGEAGAVRRSRRGSSGGSGSEGGSGSGSTPARQGKAGGKWRVSYEVIGDPPNVAVPTHFFKVILAEDGRPGGSVALGAFVLPNAPIANDKPLADFEVPLEAVERASGLEFAQLLPAQRRRRLCAEVECSLLVRDFQKKTTTKKKGGEGEGDGDGDGDGEASGVFGNNSSSVRKPSALLGFGGGGGSGDNKNNNAGPRSRL
jgi:endonuclease G